MCLAVNEPVFVNLLEPCLAYHQCYGWKRGLDFRAEETESQSSYAACLSPMSDEQTDPKNQIGYVTHHRYPPTSQNS